MVNVTKPTSDHLLEVNKMIYISKNQRIWIKSDLGNVYICPTNLEKDPKDMTEEELRQNCLDDSDRPDNY